MHPSTPRYWFEHAGDRGFLGRLVQPCRLLSPELEELAEENAGTVVVVNENPETSADFGITSIPSVLLFDDGESKAAVIGAHRPSGEAWTELASAVRKASRRRQLRLNA
ncbi:thioredoxin domain-containing protein [Sinomonas sp. ASV486]|uniref:thioredoxin domain-containing protein n=1 Tax=Sinomonas sp. ASV486 TaxID=3051170 RepID=UPI0027DC8FC7|nr:thioredoxin domain-containing protein [Sinomonas sp. ASV486]MDQ4489812.1 thioredoxin domain-containing protein [Sinomonas sp. ASV486]